jgi:hypothetical protein
MATNGLDFSSFDMPESQTLYWGNGFPNLYLNPNNILSPPGQVIMPMHRPNVSLLSDSWESWECMSGSVRLQLGGT